VSQNSNHHGINHLSSCYVVERVDGGTIFTTWDLEEARQLANSLLLSGKNTENSLAVRRVACSKLPPPIDENGKPPLEDTGEGNASISYSKCKDDEYATIGYCIERFDPPEDVDLSSVTRKKQGHHFVVRVARRGSWDPLHRRYLNSPILFEIWHPTNEQSCDLEYLHSDVKLTS